MVKLENELSKWVGIPGDGSRTHAEPRKIEAADEHGGIVKQAVWIGADGRAYATQKQQEFTDTRGRYGFPDDVGLVEWSNPKMVAAVPEVAREKLGVINGKATWTKPRVVWIASPETSASTTADLARRWTAYRLIHDVLVDPRHRPGAYVSMRRAPSDLAVQWDVWERAKFLVVDHCWLELDGTRVHRLADLLTARPDGASVVLLGARVPTRATSPGWARVCAVLGEDRSLKVEVG